MGGGNPEAFGISLGTKILGTFWVNGTYYEYNFTKLLENVQIDFDAGFSNGNMYWNIDAKNYGKNHRVKISFTNPLSKCFAVNYENPQGVKNHTNCQNGGHASGTVELYERKWFLIYYWKKIETYVGEGGYGEWGQY
jgi:hypothetical protein